MGAQQSYPIPTDKDFAVAASKTANLKVCEPALTCNVKQPHSNNSLHFSLDSKAWNDKDGHTTEVPELGVKLVVAISENKDERLLLVRSSQPDDTLLVVLRQPAEYPRPLQICIPTKTTTATNKVVTTYQGQTLYEYATVDRLRSDAKQHVLRISGYSSTNNNNNNNKPLLWRTDRCGGRTVVRDKIIHAVQHVNDKPKSKKTLEGVTLGAYLQEQPNHTWGVRMTNATGLDPLLLLCLVVCTDRWAVADSEFFRNVSRVSIHNTGGRGLFKNIT